MTTLRQVFAWAYELPLRVATKFVMAFAAFALIGAGLIAVLLANREAQRLAANIETDLRAQGRALAPVLSDVSMREGEARMLELVRSVDAADANVQVSLERVSAPRPAAQTVVVHEAVSSPSGARQLGFIEVVSEPGEGTMMSVHLPDLSSADVVDHDFAQSEQSAPNGIRFTSTAWRDAEPTSDTQLSIRSEYAAQIRT